MEIVNPLTGQRIVFRRTGAETGGAFSQMEMLYQPGAWVDAEHLHPVQEEQFEVIEGTLRFVVDGREQVAGPGAVVMVPPRTPHTFSNIGAGVARVRVTYRPALRNEAFFVSYFGLAHAGRLDPRSHMPNLLQLAVMLRAFRDELRPMAVTPWLDRLLLRPLGVVAGLLGYSAEVPYPGAETPSHTMVKGGQR